jgi:hypothetical protein
MYDTTNPPIPTRGTVPASMSSYNNPSTHFQTLSATLLLPA